MRVPSEWHDFLQNDLNKKQLFQMLLDVWSSDSVASKYEGGKSIIRVVEGVAHEFTTEFTTVSSTVRATQIPSLRSNQNESGTQFVLYLQYAQDKGFESAVIRSPDSDVFFILLHYAKEFTIAIWLDTGRRLINILITQLFSWAFTATLAKTAPVHSRAKVKFDLCRSWRRIPDISMFLLTWDPTGMLMNISKQNWSNSHALCMHILAFPALMR